MESDKLHGIGWEFPPSFEKIDNSPSMLSGEEDVINSIYVILHTKLGERIMRNEFGSNIYDLLFEPLNVNMKTYMASSLKRALSINEPRINVQSVLLEQPDLGIGRIDIEIEFSFIETNETRNLVVPFYKPDNVR